jgi:hypothetical protein
VRPPSAVGALQASARHWLFVLLLSAGIALRVVTSLAYRPALIYIDAVGYLQNEAHLKPELVRPLGYPIFLRILPLGLGLWVVPVVQHALALAMAVAIYALLLRLGVTRWLAALATAPVLLDVMQLNLEQEILTETLFEALLLAAVLLLLWRGRPGLLAAGLTALALAGATLTRSVALLVIVPAALTILFLRAGLTWHAVATRLLALGAVFAVPLVLYAAWFESLYGVFALNGFSGHFLYARVAPFADCKTLSLPSYERVLCPKQPVGQRPSIEAFSWSRTKSPLFRLRVPASIARGKAEPVARSQVAGNFAKRVILNQPLTYLHEVEKSFVRGFAPTRTSHAGEVPVGRWQFQNHFPIYGDSLTIMARHHERPQVDGSLASFLRSYQRFVYTPGPVLALALVLALLGALGLGPARRSGLRSASVHLSGSTLVVLVTAVAVNQFSWRYQLPQLILLPPAGALGLVALTGRFRRLEDEHGVAEGVEAVALLDREPVEATRLLDPGEGHHEGEEGGTRQVEVGQERVDPAELEAGRDE